MHAIIIEDEGIPVRPSPEHEYLVESKLVARGYGVSPEVIRQHKANHAEELKDGKHWTTVQNLNGGAPLTLWTKRGVIRLGFFIKSARAAQFRDAAEDLILGQPPAASADVAALTTAMTTLATTVTKLAVSVAAGDECYRRLALGQYNIQNRIEALERREPRPVVPLPPPVEVDPVEQMLCAICERALGPRRSRVIITTATMADMCAATDELSDWPDPDGRPLSTALRIGFRLSPYIGRWLGDGVPGRYWIERRRTADGRLYAIRRAGGEGSAK